MRAGTEGRLGATLVREESLACAIRAFALGGRETSGNSDGECKTGRAIGVGRERDPGIDGGSFPLDHLLIRL